MSNVMIVGLHKAQVLLALYDNANFAGEGFKDQPFLKVQASMWEHGGDIKKAEELIDEGLSNNRLYFDYIDLGCGPKPLKVDLSGFDFDPSSYDHNHGAPGYAARVITSLQNAMISAYKDEPKDSFAGLLATMSSILSNDKKSSEEDSKQELDSESNLSL